MEYQVLEGAECKVCRNQARSEFSRKFYKNSINIVQCDRCSFVFIPPYYRKQINYAEYKNEDSLRAVVAGNNWLKVQRHKLRFKAIKKYCSRGKLFDLGVGWGHFLYTGQLLGYEVEGIEMAKMPFTYAKEHLNLPVECVDFFDYEPKTEHYDLITMWDVLEHIDSCDRAVEKCHSMLKQGGHIVIQVPQVDSFIAKRHKEAWQAMGLDHVNYFSRKTIAALLDTNGFEVKEIRSSIELKHFLMYSIFDKKRKKEGAAQATQAERQEYYNKKVNRPKWQLKLFVYVHDILYNLLSALNIGDEMIVIAKKK